jgi:hypothetical protein
MGNEGASGPQPCSKIQKGQSLLKALPFFVLDVNEVISRQPYSRDLFLLGQQYFL